jgi:hypothetical protein
MQTVGKRGMRGMGQLTYLSRPMPGGPARAGQEVMLEGEQSGSRAGGDADLLVGMRDVVPDGLQPAITHPPSRPRPASPVTARPAI